LPPSSLNRVMDDNGADQGRDEGGADAQSILIQRNLPHRDG